MPFLQDFYESKEVCFKGIKNCIDSFLAVLSLYCCMGFSPVVVSGGYSLAAVYGLLTAVASLLVGHRL